jgi:hypothetical protein
MVTGRQEDHLCPSHNAPALQQGGMVWNGYDIWTVKSDGTQEQRLTNENSNRIGGSSPYDYEVWLTNPAFGRTVQLTHLHSRLNSPTFTRDGQYIHFSSDGQFGTTGNPSPLPPGGKTPLWQIKPDGSDLKQIR